jgi:Mannosyltransferase (PIG-V)
VETVPQRLEPLQEPVELSSLDAVAPAQPALTDQPDARSAARRSRAPGLSPAVRHELVWVTGVYLATRVLLLLTAAAFAAIGNHNFLNELANWDGLWYREVANHGYVDHVSYAQTTLGFLPLFPIAIWILEPLFSLVVPGQILASTVAGVVISTAGGLIATVLVNRMASGWWGRESARRATLLFCVFPGSVVFSMVYSEGILLPLAVGCLYALQQRRFLLAGILAGLATAVGPTALVLIPVCAVSAVREWRRRGWGVANARRVLVAPVLSVTGIAIFALFLWAWTGSPWASYIAQHHGWSEKTDPLAMVHLVTTLAGQISFTHLNEPTINLNLVVGLIGGFLLLGMLVIMFKVRRSISLEAILWTLGIAFLALTSEYVPPNPRMLLTAFPAIMVAGHYIRGRWFRALMWTNVVLLVLLSTVTFYGVTLRP